MHRPILSVLTFAAVVAAAPAVAQAEISDTASRFLATLNADEHAAATWPFRDAERLDIHYAPFDLDGLRHGGLDGEQHAAAEDLLARSLSMRGFDKIRAIRLLERDVRQLEAGRSRSRDGFRDPGRYHWAFFGLPATDTPWGYRYEGHHLSLNITVVPGQPAASLPLFLGAQPRNVPVGLPSAGVAALGTEEALARKLYASLDDDQRAVATLPFKAGRAHMLGQVSTLDSPAAVGLAFARMTREQQSQLIALLGEFATLWNAEISAVRLAETDAARDGLHFAFVARDDPPFSFYTRIQGPGVLLEIDNTEGGDHVHAVWHRPGDDFGHGLLAAHMRAHHAVVQR